ncbi:MAG: tRNA glutamyl-Q(34) synthetase GluQRS [Gammaproteobacteria bacterium]|nr:tRNA glutamyl-Q(34) synthetase GluQRS [Gammaproteobacteria bacterium]
MIVGRFAPSPTGSLHVGSLIAALASYCEARTQAGRWFVRIDDIDPPREELGASERILQTLDRYGFSPDQIIYQSSRTNAYASALRELNNQAQLYTCACPRKDQPFCDCRLTQPAPRADRFHGYSHGTAIRFRLQDTPQWLDLIQPEFESLLIDPVVYRKDGLFSYALACAVDDSTEVSQVVRGFDLIELTAIQIALMQALERPIPVYAHVPVAVNSQQQKLSKQTLAEPVDALPILDTLFKVWGFLGQTPFKATSTSQFWDQALDKWSLDTIPKVGSRANPVRS